MKPLYATFLTDMPPIHKDRGLKEYPELPICTQLCCAVHVRSTRKYDLSDMN